MPNPYAGLGLIPADNPIPGMIDASAERYGVDRNLAHVVAQMESNYNPHAVSGAGAQGVMQLMPATARSLGVTDSFDPAQNIDGGVKYLAELSKRYDGDPRLVLAAYNAGPGAVDRAGGVPRNPETQNYVALGTRKLGSANREAPSAPATGQGTQNYADLGLIPVEPPASVEILPPLSEPPDWKPSPPEKTFKGFLDNATTGVGRILEVADLPETLKNVTNLLQGMSEKSGFAPVMGQPRQQVVDGIVDLYKQRYGSLEGFKNAWYDDPVGMAGDVATVFSGAGLGMKAAQDFLEASGLTQHAAAIADILPEAEAGIAQTRWQAGFKGAAEALGRRYREVVQAGIEKAPSGILGGPHGMLSTAKYGAAKKAGEILKEGWQAGTAAYDAPAGEAAAGAPSAAAAPQPATRGPIITPPPEAPAPQAPPISRVMTPEQVSQAFPELSPEFAASVSRELQGVPPQATAPPMTTTEMGTELTGRSPSKLSETQKAQAATVLSEAQPPAPSTAPVPQAPPGGPSAAIAEPTAAEVSQPRVDALTDFVKKNVPPQALADYLPHEWGMLGEAAGVESLTPDEIAAVRSNIADWQASKPSNMPAEAAAQFEEKKAGVSPYTETGELKSKAARATEMRAAKVEAKAQRWAQALSKLGLTAEGVEGLEPGLVPAESLASGAAPGWTNVMHDLIAKGLLETSERNPPQSSLPRILEIMRAQEGPRAEISTAMLKTAAEAEKAFAEAKAKPAPRPTRRRTPEPRVER